MSSIEFGDSQFRNPVTFSVTVERKHAGELEKQMRGVAEVGGFAVEIYRADEEELALPQPKYDSEGRLEYRSRLTTILYDRTAERDVPALTERDWVVYAQVNGYEPQVAVDAFVHVYKSVQYDAIRGNLDRQPIVQGQKVNELGGALEETDHGIRLAEIEYVLQHLSQPENREKLAGGLYPFVVSYLRDVLTPTPEDGAVLDVSHS